jgi:hypothetical protein
VTAGPSTPELLDRLDDELRRYALTAEPGHAVVVDNAWHKLWAPFWRRLLWLWSVAETVAGAGVALVVTLSQSLALLLAALGVLTGATAAGGLGLAWAAAREGRHVVACPGLPPRRRDEGLRPS